MAGDLKSIASLSSQRSRVRSPSLPSWAQAHRFVAEIIKYIWLLKFTITNGVSFMRALAPFLFGNQIAPAVAK